MSHEPRQMSLLFSDVTGNVSLYERLSEIEAAHAVDRCQKRISRCVEAGRGRVVQVSGHEMMAVFETPEDAGLAAIDMQERITDLPPVSGLKLSIRIGLHVGVIEESGQPLSGPAAISAARIAGRAVSGQIIISAPLLAVMPEPLASSSKPLPKLGDIKEGGGGWPLYELVWREEEPPAAKTVSAPQTAHLQLSYHDKKLLLDQQPLPFTLGRDVDSHLLIEDRKASRKHARIERRPQGFFYIDDSTNGSFVSFDTGHEFVLRQDEILINGNAYISFGTSVHDPESDCIRLELKKRST